MEAYITHYYNARYNYDKNFNCIVTGDFCYETSKPIELYDSEGNFVKKDYIVKRNVIHKKDTFQNLGIRHTTTVCQIDFDFIKIDCPFYSTVDDLAKVNWKSLNSKIVPAFVDCPRDEKRNLEYAEPVEFIGFYTKAYQVNRYLGKKILDFNFEKYNENRVKAIENKLDEEWLINMIFRQNLTMLSFYFMCSVDDLKSPKFDIKKQIMKRLNYKIHQKELEIMYDKNQGF